MTRLWGPRCRELNNLQVSLLDQWSPPFSASRTGFVGKKKKTISQDWGAGWLTHTTFTSHFISIIIPPASPQIVGHQPWNPGTPVATRCSTTTLHGTWSSFCPFPQFRWFSLRLNATRLCSVYAPCVRLREQGSKVGVPWQALRLKGCWKELL